MRSLNEEEAFRFQEQLNAPLPGRAVDGGSPAEAEAELADFKQFMGQIG